MLISVRILLEMLFEGCNVFSGHRRLSRWHAHGWWLQRHLARWPQTKRHLAWWKRLRPSSHWHHSGRRWPVHASWWKWPTWRHRRHKAWLASLPREHPWRWWPTHESTRTHRRWNHTRPVSSWNLVRSTWPWRHETGRHPRSHWLLRKPLPRNKAWLVK